MNIKSKLSSHIQDEIKSGKILIDDKNTRNLCKKFISYTKDISAEKENLSEEQKEKAFQKFLEMYDEVENAYIDCLVAKHLSMK